MDEQSPLEKEQAITMMTEQKNEEEKKAASF